MRDTLRRRRAIQRFSDSAIQRFSEVRYRMQHNIVFFKDDEGRIYHTDSTFGRGGEELLGASRDSTSSNLLRLGFAQAARVYRAKPRAPILSSHVG
jgi:hypothetical protein